MKKIVLLFLLLIGFTCNSQSLTINNLLALNLLSISEIDFYLNKEKFVMTNSTKNDGHNTITYTYIDDNILPVFILVDRSANNSHLIYSFQDYKKNSELMAQLLDMNFRLSNTFFDKEGNLQKYYIWNKFSILTEFDSKTNIYTYIFDTIK